MVTAEEHKESGNKAFAAKNFTEAIEHYTKAIRVDPTNHVYFSNRSASHAGLKTPEAWKEAITDAKQCIKINPSFIKGYYRLATAQIEIDDLDAASATIKQGLNVEPDNSNLAKLKRNIRAKKVAMKATAAKLQQESSSAMAATSSAAAVANSSAAAAAGADSALAKEIMDLQNQLKSTVKDYSIVNGDIMRAQKTKKVNEITLQELDTIKLDDDENDGVKMYRGVGKMFMASSRTEVDDMLKKEIKDCEKKGTELSQKKDYLERRLKSQQQNILELTGNAQTRNE